MAAAFCPAFCGCTRAGRLVPCRVAVEGQTYLPPPLWCGLVQGTVPPAGAEKPGLVRTRALWDAQGREMPAEQGSLEPSALDPEWWWKRF